jgi:hypothetical protein
VILLALVLVGFGAADLVRWSPERVGGWHALAAAGVGTGAVAALAALGGMCSSGVLLAALVALAVLGLWSAYDLLPPERARSEYALALVLAAVGLSVAFSGSGRAIGGDVADWYSNLAFGFTADVSVDRFVIGFGASLFLLGTANRIVRYTLGATGVSLAQGEGALRGGRLLGPIERIFVAASIVSGSLAGAGFVVAAKGLLRFREIGERDRPRVDGGTEGNQPKVDVVTEYFLIGTFTSVLVAAATAVLVLAAS